MLGTNRKIAAAVLATRVNRIAQAPTYTPPKPADVKFGKRAQRKIAWRPATLSFQSGERMDVVVKNISETGARIEFVRSTYLPDRVKLSAQGISKWAYVSWQTWGVAGLHFVDSKA